MMFFLFGLGGGPPPPPTHNKIPPPRGGGPPPPRHEKNDHTVHATRVLAASPSSFVAGSDFRCSRCYHDFVAVTDVLLVVPPFSMSSLEFDEGSQNRGYYVYYPPLGLGSMATVLNQDSRFRARVVDCYMEGLDEAGLMRRLVQQAPGVVGLTVTTPTLRAVHRLSRAIRAALPQTRLVLGGPHLNVDTTVAEDLVWDDILQNESDLFLRDVLSDGPKGGVHQAPPVLLEDLPDIDRSLFHAGPYRNPFNGVPTTSLEASRGCPFRCSFCSRTLSETFRLKPPERVAAEMARCQKNGIGFFVFIDEIFTKNRPHTEALMKAVRRLAPRARFSVQTRVEYVDDDLMQNMKSAGLEVISFGVESFLPRHRQAMGKNFSDEQVHRAISAAHRAGVRVNGFMLMGIPGQTAADVAQDFALAVKSGLDFTLPNVLTVLPGTPLAVDLPGHVWRDYLLEKRDLPLVSELPREALTALKNDWFRRWYLRPRMIWRLITMSRTLQDLMALASLGVGVLRDYALKNRRTVAAAQINSPV